MTTETRSISTIAYDIIQNWYGQLFHGLGDRDTQSLSLQCDNVARGQGEGDQGRD